MAWRSTTTITRRFARPLLGFGAIVVPASATFLAVFDDGLIGLVAPLAGVMTFVPWVVLFFLLVERRWTWHLAIIATALALSLAAHSAGMHMRRVMLLREIPRYHPVAERLLKRVESGKDTELRENLQYPSGTVAVASRNAMSGVSSVRFFRGVARRGVVYFPSRRNLEGRQDCCLRPLRENWYEFWPCGDARTTGMGCP